MIKQQSTIIIALCILAAACGKPPTSAENQIRELISTIESAAENKDRDKIVASLAVNFRDAIDQDRQAVAKLLRFYFLRNQSIHLFIKVNSIDLISNDHAQVELLAAMSAQPVSEHSSLLNIKADIYRFKLSIVNEGGDWQILHAKWQPAAFSDF